MAQRDNLLALAVLSYLTQGPMHPYELGRTLQRHGDARSIRYRHASLYMVVERLATAGLVVAVDTGREGARPERTRYALTDAGRQELRAWMKDLLAEPVHEHPRFVAALAFVAALPVGEVLDALGRRSSALDAVRAEVEEVIRDAADAGVHPMFVVEEQYRLALVDAERDFVAGLRATLADPASGWADAWPRAAADARPAR